MGTDRSSQGPDLWGSKAQGWSSLRPRRPAFSGPRRPQRPSAAFEWPPFFSPRHTRRPKAPRARWLGGGCAHGPQSWARGAGSRRGLGSEMPPPSAPRWGWEWGWGWGEPRGCFTVCAWPVDGCGEGAGSLRVRARDLSPGPPVHPPA